MDDPFAAFRKFVWIAGILLVAAVGVALLGLTKVAKVARTEAAPPQPPKTSSPEETRARAIAGELEAYQGEAFWRRAEEIGKSLTDTSQVLALFALAEGAPDPRVIAMAAVVRSRLSAWSDRKIESAALGRAWHVFGPTIERHARSDPDASTRIGCIRILAAFSSGCVPLTALLQDPNVRSEALAALRSRAGRDVYDRILAAFEAETDSRRAGEIADLLAEINHREGDESFRDHVDRVILPKLRSFFDGAAPGGEESISAARAMAAVRYMSVNQLLIEDFVRYGDKPSRLRALAVLATTGREESNIPELLADAMRGIEDEEVVRAARDATEKMTR